MIKVEAVVIRERVETVIDAVEEQTGHVGVTVVEAIGHGRQRGITHEYRGRTFESRFLPKAVLTFVVAEEIAARRGRRDLGFGAERQRVGRRDRLDDAGRKRHSQPDGTEAGGGGARMTTEELVIAASTVWVVVAAVLVMFMQAGFAFLEAGLTRMKNAGHIAAKNVLVLGIASLVYYIVGFGIAFGDGGNGLVGGSGFAPSSEELLAVGAAPFSWFTSIPAGAAYFFQVVFAAVSLAIVWGAMAERTKLWVYFAFGVVFTLVYSVVSHWIWHPDGWLFAMGMQDFAGSTVVHYQGALAALAGALLLGPRIGKFDADGRPNAIPGHNMAFVTLGVLILWFGWFGFNPGSTLGVVTGDRIGYFAYVALTTNVAAAAGAIGAVTAAWIVLRKPDLSMMLNGVIAALVAVTAAAGFVAPWAAIVIGLVAGVIAVLGVLLVERIRIDDPIGAVAVHGMAGVWGTLATGHLRGAGAGREPRDGHGRACVHGELRPARDAGARAARRRPLHVQCVVRLALGDEGAVGNQGRAGGRDGRARRVRTRHVGLPRVLHPGPGRLRDGVPRPPARPRPPPPLRRRRARGRARGSLNTELRVPDQGIVGGETLTLEEIDALFGRPDDHQLNASLTCRRLSPPNELRSNAAAPELRPCVDVRQVGDLGVLAYRTRNLVNQSYIDMRDDLRTQLRNPDLPPAARDRLREKPGAFSLELRAAHRLACLGVLERESEAHLD